MLIQTGSVKHCKPLLLRRKISRYPFHNHTDSVLMHIINEIHKIFWCSIARTNCVISNCWISIRIFLYTFHQRHELNMGIPHFFYIFRQSFCCVPITLSCILVFFGKPAIQTDFIYIKCFLCNLYFLPFLHPFGIFP